jgi:type I restriction enzyme S subunit
VRDGWKTATLGDVLALIRNGTNCEQTKVVGGVKISRIETIATSSINPDKVGYAVLTDNQKNNFKLRINDILFSHINSAPHVGKTAIVEQDYEIYHGINLLLFRPTDDVDPKYLQYYLTLLHKSGYWRGVCKQSVNQASVNQTDIKKVTIKYPKCLEQQRRIVAALDEAHEGINAVIANVERNLTNLAELKQAILQKAFAGELPIHAAEGVNEAAE